MADRIRAIVNGRLFRNILCCICAFFTVLPYCGIDKQDFLQIFHGETLPQVTAGPSSPTSSDSAVPNGEETPSPTPEKTPEPATDEPSITPTPAPGPTPYMGTGQKSPDYKREAHHYSMSVNFPDNYAVENTYYIKVVINAQLVYIYSRDRAGNPKDLVRTLIVSTGIDKGSNATPLGRFMVLDAEDNSAGKHKWVKFDGSYGQFATRLFYITEESASGMKGYFTGYMFHSELYRKTDPTSLIVAEYNTIGYPRSHGCIRMQIKDARWIYLNCPTGSIVEVVDGSPDPSLWSELRPPALPYGTDYDPTDPAKPGVEGNLRCQGQLPSPPPRQNRPLRQFLRRGLRNRPHLRRLRSRRRQRSLHRNLQGTAAGHGMAL